MFRWAAYQSGAYPELALMYHVPNEGMRSRATGGRMQSEGMKRGVPDICLPVARGGHHGLYIELKRIAGGRLSTDQAGWLEALAREGYCAILCKGWEDAAQMIMDYLKSGTKEGGAGRNAGR